MDEFVVNKNAWHYRWLTFYKSFNTDEWSKSKYPTDFCAYWRAVLLWPALRIGFNLLVNLIIVGMLYFIFTTVVSGLLMTLGVVITVIALIVLMALFSVGWTKLSDKVKNKMQNLDNDEFVSTAYSSYKNKFCKKVKYDA